MIAVFVLFIGTSSAQVTITRLGDASAGAVSLVAISNAGSSRVVTPVRDGAGDLKVIAWDLKRFPLGSGTPGRSRAGFNRTGDGSSAAFSARKRTPVR